MDIKLNANSGIRPTYYKKQPCAPKEKACPATAGRKMDSVEISPDRSGGEGTGFGSFMDELSKLLSPEGFPSLAGMDVQANQRVRNRTGESVQTLLAQAGVEHSEDVSPEGSGPCSRVRLLMDLEERHGVRGAGLRTERSSGETACFSSFMDEFDKLLSKGGFPNMAVMDMQANQNVRNQMERSLQTLFAQAGVQFPEDMSFRLTVAPGDYYIKADGLRDSELAQRIEEAVNKGDNGRRLYYHIQYCNPARFGYAAPAHYAAGHTLGLDYKAGRLADIGTEYGYGPGQTGWQAGIRERPEEAGLRYMEQAGKIARSLEMK